MSLTKGWNLVSVPGQLVDPTVKANLTGIADKVYYLNATGGWDYGVARGTGWIGNLIDIEEGKGYWINALLDVNLILNVTPTNRTAPAPSRSLVEGWNMIGYTPRDLAPSASVATYLASLSGKWVALYRYDPVAGYEIAKPGYGFSTVDLGRGYLVNLASEGTLLP